VHTTLVLVNHALVATSSGGSTKKSGSSWPLLILIAAFGLIYLFVLRPRSRQRAAAAAAARKEITVGDEVTTTAGLIATVVAIEDDFLTLEVAPGVLCRYVPAAILRVNAPDAPTDGGPDPSTHEVIEQPGDSPAPDPSTDDNPPT